jgi:drug/metabolite transporter (DMT)-like permease
MNLIFYSLLIALFWGISPIAQKKLLNNMDTKFILISTGLFYSLFFIIYSMYNWTHFKYECTQVNNKTIIYLAVVAFMLSFIPNIIYFFLLKQHDSSIVSALVNSAPVFTVLVSFLILGEKIHKYELIGIFFIIIGIIAISLRH